jgi:hypothetical protein
MRALNPSKHYVIVLWRGGYAKTNDLDFVFACERRGQLRPMGVWWGMQFFRWLD